MTIGDRIKPGTTNNKLQRPIRSAIDDQSSEVEGKDRSKADATQVIKSAGDKAKDTLGV